MIRDILMVAAVLAVALFGGTFIWCFYNATKFVGN
jgi:hypothetical protein